MPSRQASQVPQVLKFQATPTRSPTARWVTLAPRSTTRPTTSCPGIRFALVAPFSAGWSPSATCRSEWQTPQTSTSISTSSGPGTGRGTSSTLRVGPNS